MSKFPGYTKRRISTVLDLEDVLFPDTLDPENCGAYQNELSTLLKDQASKRGLKPTSPLPKVAEFLEAALTVSQRQSNRPEHKIQFLAAHLSGHIALTAATIFCDRREGTLATIADKALDSVDQSLQRLKNSSAEHLEVAIHLRLLLLTHLMPLKYGTARLKDMIVKEYEQIALQMPERFSVIMKNHCEGIDLSNPELRGVIQRSFDRSVTNPNMALGYQLRICREALTTLPFLGGSGVQIYKDICERAAMKYDRKKDVKDIYDHHCKECGQLRIKGVNSELYDIATAVLKIRNLPLRPRLASPSPQAYLGDYSQIN